jgi:C_GCAxxG_C_C family probable redox protein
MASDRATTPGDRPPEDRAAATAGRGAAGLARRLFLDDRHAFGCAETAFVVLKSVYGLDDPTSSSAAMALNGGIAYSGGPCGALTGAALAVGMLAERRLDDHGRAKRVARELVARELDDFVREHGSADCRDLIGFDLRAEGGHDAFLASGAWRTTCMGQIEHVVGRLARLAEPDAWARAVEEVEAGAP